MEKELFDKRKKRIRDLIYDKHYQPMKQKEIGYLLQVEPEDRKEFVQILHELVDEGVVEVSKRGKYSPVSKKTLTGTCLFHGRKIICFGGRRRRRFLYQ